MKPTEVRAVAAIFGGGDQAEVLARQILRTVNEMRGKEKVYVVNLFDVETSRYLSAWGPYVSYKEAAKDLEDGGVVTSRQSRAHIAVLVTSATRAGEDEDE